MFHHIPDSPHRARLLEIVGLQTRLMEKLCALAPNAVADLAWLKGIWHDVDGDWVQRFWDNDKGNRANWIRAIAVATVASKHELLALVNEQLSFAELYHAPPTVRLQRNGWKAEPFKSAKQLLVSFYAPLFYNGEGYPNADGTRFHKDHFIGVPPKVCPYTDNFVQDTKLDHFLPKDDFPMLSLHPDNLIPCGTDPNSFSHKGAKMPLNPIAHDQAAAWFHPRWRPAGNPKEGNAAYHLNFPNAPAPHPRVQFAALVPGNQVRLDNLNGLFDLTKFWGQFLDDEIQLIASEIQCELREDAIAPTEQVIVQRLQRASQRMQNRIGRDALAIVKSAYYSHIAQTPNLLDQVVRTCVTGS